MGLSGCGKVVVNQYMVASMESFHDLRKTTGWKNLTEKQREHFNAVALKIEKEAVKKYEPLLEEMVETIGPLDE